MFIATSFSIQAFITQTRRHEGACTCATKHSDKTATNNRNNRLLMTHWRRLNFVLRGRGYICRELTPFSTAASNKAASGNRVPANPHTKRHLDPFSSFITMNFADRRIGRQTDHAVTLPYEL